MPRQPIAAIPKKLSDNRTPNFDRIARPYRLLEYLILGRSLTRTRTTHLRALSACRNALILGDGDGRALAALLHANPHLRATAVDSSRAMLRLLAVRCAFASHRLTTLQAEAPTFLTKEEAAHAPFDLITTHFFLDCFSELELAQLIAAICDRLAPGGLWAISEFRIPPAGPLRLLARLLVRTLYLAFRLLTGLRPTRLPDFATLLHRAGLIRIRTQHSLGGLLTAELWQRPENTPRANPQ